MVNVEFIVYALALLIALDYEVANKSHHSLLKPLSILLCRKLGYQVWLSGENNLDHALRDTCLIVIEHSLDIVSKLNKELDFFTLKHLVRQDLASKSEQEQHSASFLSFEETHVHGDYCLELLEGVLERLLPLLDVFRCRPVHLVKHSHYASHELLLRQVSELRVSEALRGLDSFSEPVEKKGETEKVRVLLKVCSNDLPKHLEKSLAAPEHSVYLGLRVKLLLREQQ